MFKGQLQAKITFNGLTNKYLKAKVILIYIHTKTYILENRY